MHVYVPGNRFASRIDCSPRTVALRGGYEAKLVDIGVVLAIEIEPEGVFETLAKPPELCLFEVFKARSSLF